MSYEAEQNVIGSLLTRPECLDEVINILTPEMFRTEILARAYAEFLKGQREKKEVNLATLMEQLPTDSIPASVISQELRSALKATTTTSTVKSYARTLCNEHRAAELNEALKNIRGQPQSVNEDIERVLRIVSSLRESDADDLHTLAEITEQYKDSYFKDDGRKRIMTGMERLDEILGGFDGGDLILIGARPAVGKSAFAAQLSMHFATQCNLKVGYFNLEMQDKQIYERFVAARSGIELRRIRMATRFLQGERELFEEANNFLMTVKDIVISTGSKKISDIRAECAGQNFGIVIIDYLQLVKSSGQYRGNRYAEVGQISHEAKALAMDLNIPVIALCQLNRAVEGRSDREPTMADIRESGDFEQDASTILLLWNTNPNNPSEKSIKVEKQRQGKIGKVDLEFDGNRMKFKEVRNRDGSIPGALPKHRLAPSVQMSTKADSQGWATASDDIPFDF